MKKSTKKDCYLTEQQDWYEQSLEILSGEITELKKKEQTKFNENLRIFRVP
nr:hypothetical protein [Mycoplasmopsis bovis]